jgi:hypothetical protein
MDSIDYRLFGFPQSLMIGEPSIDREHQALAHRARRHLFHDRETPPVMPPCFL